MIRVLRQLTSLPGLLALATVGLGVTVAVQFNDPPEVPAPAADVEAAAPDDGTGQSEAQPFDPRPLESYAGIEARPLFMPSRRPPPPEASAAGGGSGHDTLMLAGVILTNSKRLAMIETKRTSGVVVVREGQVVEGWNVDEIGPDRVVISQNDEVFELLLDDKLKAPRKEVRRTPRTQPEPRPQPQPQQQPRAQPAPSAPADEGLPQDREGAPAEEPEDAGAGG
ncbi:MAG: hypothetical protein JNM75_04155 [Rhodospirillales bacterium]|nr:hypothetical protein [Rhodospirillales bacterium]